MQSSGLTQNKGPTYGRTSAQERASGGAEMETAPAGSAVQLHRAEGAPPVPPDTFAHYAEPPVQRRAGASTPVVQAKPTADSAVAETKVSLRKQGAMTKAGFIEPGKQDLEFDESQIQTLGLVNKKKYKYHIEQSPEDAAPKATDPANETAEERDERLKKAGRGQSLGKMRRIDQGKVGGQWEGKEVPGGKGKGRRYTEAGGGQKKFEIDQALANDGVKIDPASEQYWKAFIALTGKAKKISVLDDAPGMQFFFLDSAWEGFFPKEKVVDNAFSYTGDSASDNVKHDATRGDKVNVWNPLAGKKEGKEEFFNASNTLVVFNSKGKLVFVSPLLTRFSTITEDGEAGKKFTQDQGNWDGKEVVGARPKGFDYYGLSVRDGDNYHADIHEPIGSHGCFQQGTAALDYRYTGGGNKAYDKSWAEFQSKYLEAHGQVGKGTFRYTGAVPFTLKATFDHIAHAKFDPQIVVQPVKK